MNRSSIEKITKSPAIRDIFKWSQKEHPQILLLCLLNIISAGTTLGITLSTKGLIDGATAHNSREVWLFGGLLVLAVGTARVAGLAAGILNVNTGARLLKNMRAMFFERVLKKQYCFLNGYHSGELVNRMFSDITVVRNGVMEIVPEMVNMAVSFVGATVILVTIEWRMVLLLLVGSFAGLTLILAFRKPLKGRHKAVQEAEGRLHSILQEALENIRLLKASGCEKRIEQQVENRQESYLDAQLKKGRFSVWMGNSINLVFQGGWLVCMLWGCVGIYRGTLTYGMLAALLQLIGQIQQPMANAAGIASKIYGTISSAERLTEILKLPEEDAGELSAEAVPYEKLAEIKLENVSFAYEKNGKPVLQNLNAGIRPGDFVAVTGSSGSGKSTLFQLLLGIYEPDAGKIGFYFEGKNSVPELPSERTRKLFAYVPQGNTLFSGTLRENLCMFAEDAKEEEIKKALETACIVEMVESLKDGLDTVIGERGVGLSEGQAQRVAIARALLGGAPVLLLDESTSALDEKTEARLLQNLSRLEKKTCLIVTHRPGALKICNRRLHIEKGHMSFLNFQI